MEVELYLFIGHNKNVHILKCREIEHNLYDKYSYIGCDIQFRNIICYRIFSLYIDIYMINYKYYNVYIYLCIYIFAS